jgi:UDP-glucose:(heptosyl)LPS alpha-1,3-glucosyltransferase
MIMKIAFCYDQVFPARGGCGTYITDLSRRLVADQHEVHLYACRWDEQALPAVIQMHALPLPRGPRFWRPWRFARECEKALSQADHDVSVGFDKTWGQDVLYPQGGLHVASVDHNLDKFRNPVVRGVARLCKWLDVTHWSFAALERRQYLSSPRPLVVVNSHMVRDHFEHYYGVPAENLHVIRSSIDPGRFPEQDRLRRRVEFRDKWGIGPDETVALFAAINYRLKGLEPLLHALRGLVHRADYATSKPFRLVIAGSPDYRSWYRLAERLGVAEQVCFIGLCREMPSAYFAADFLVHPTFYDPCSLVVLEALACALPVITSRANGASELMHPLQEGYVVDDPHDHERLTWCMDQLIDPQRRSACAQAARRAARQWTFEQHYRQLLRVFAEAATRKRAA